jgi:hypothetical protein
MNGFSIILLGTLGFLLFIYLLVQIITSAVLTSFYREKRRITRQIIKDLKIKLNHKNKED